MRFNKQLIALSIAALFTAVTGCHTPVYNQTVGNASAVNDQVNRKKWSMQFKMKPPAPMVIKKGSYVDKTPISLKKQPYWLRNRIVIRGEQLPFSFYSRTISGGAGQHILTRYQPQLDQNTKVSLNYSGTVKGALDLLASKTGFTYTIDGQNIYWKAIITKTFDVAFIPGMSNYTMGKASASTGSAGSGGGGSGETVSAILDDSASAQFSSLSGKLSIWDDLKNAIQQMITKQGKFLVSQTTTSVTVSDKPSNVALIGKFIANINNKLSKQVLVKVEILTVSMENNFQFGINWNIVQRALGRGTYQLIANNGSPIALTSLIGLETTARTSAGINSVNLASTSGATGVISLIDALQKQGKVSLVTQPQVLCQNNQVSAIRILDQQGYLASIENSTLSGGDSASSSTITSSITPGNVMTGLTLYVLPKILGNKIFMQVNADISQNLGFASISSDGNSDASATNAATIQVPHISQKQFNQRSILKSGDTLILAGFKEVRNTSGKAQVFNSQTLGGKSAQQYSTETIVLITPILLPGIT